MAADIQHADALALVAYLEVRILEQPSFNMTYSDAAGILGRTAARDGRHMGQVTSRVDAASFYARLPFLAMHRVRQTHDGNINPRSFQGDLWRSHIPALVARAEAHVWAADDFQRIKRSLHGLGDDAATLQWKRIEAFGQKGVNRALGLPDGPV